MKRIVISFGSIVAFAALGYFLYARLSYMPLDLAPLAKYAESERYDRLIARIRAQPAGPEGFTFCVLGDTRSNYAMALRVVTAAAAEKPAFILSNGDIVRRGLPEEYVAHHLRLVEAIAPVPFITVPGNHEEGPNGDYAAFRAIYGDERFSFDYGGARFVGVNNTTFWAMRRGDLAYLDAELAKPGAAHRFVVFHEPLRNLRVYVDGEEGRGFRFNADRVKAMCRERKVDHVFMGHVHGFATDLEDGVRYTITGGGGASLTTMLGEEGNVHNYVVVRVGPAGASSEVVRLVGEAWVRSPIA